MVPALRNCWVINNKEWHLANKIKFSLKFCVKKVLYSEIVYQTFYEQKLVSVVCEEGADNLIKCYCGSET